MAVKNKRPVAGASRSAELVSRSFAEKARDATGVVTKKPSKGRRSGTVETIEARLERKAKAADERTFATKSLSQMTRKTRHRLLYEE